MQKLSVFLIMFTLALGACGPKNRNSSSNSDNAVTKIKLLSIESATGAKEKTLAQNGCKLWDRDQALLGRIF